jgi:hypothetical protein
MRVLNPHMWCRNVKELYDRLDGGTRAAASVAGLVVDAAKQPAAGATAEQLQALFGQHDSVGRGLQAGLALPLLRTSQKLAAMLCRHGALMGPSTSLCWEFR